MRTLIAWVGESDLSAAEGRAAGAGPIAGLLSVFQARAEAFGRAFLLEAGYPSQRLRAYRAWLEERLPDVEVRSHATGITERRVTDYRALLDAESAALDALDAHDPHVERGYHLSPGTPAMAVVHVLLSQTRFPGRTYQSRLDREKGTNEAEEVRLEPIWLEVLPNVLAAEARARDLPAAAELLTRDSSLREVILGVETAARLTTVPILIVGPSGTGKESLALRAHRAAGVDGEFVPINCGAIPRELFESELFGHTKGAFTGAGVQTGACLRADRGTLFLDEVSELAAEHQVKLLRALQPGVDGSFRIRPVGGARARRVRFRLVAACNRDLGSLVERGEFRRDLYYRLSTYEVRVPSLADRPADVIAFVEQGLPDLLGRVFRATRSPRPFDDDALQLLCAQRWPGNYRSLQQVLIRLHLAPSDGPITTEELRAVLPPGASDDVALAAAVDELPLSSYDETLAFVSRSFLERAWEAACKNKERAARELGLNSGTVFRNRAKALGLREIVE